MPADDARDAERVEHVEMADQRLQAVPPQPRERTLARVWQPAWS